MATTPKVLLKRSSVLGRAPTASDLEFGELAINFTDGRIYYKDTSNNIKNFVDSDLVRTMVEEHASDSAEVIALIRRFSLDSADALVFIDSDYIQYRQSYDYNALINKPDIPQIVKDNSVDSADVSAIIIADVDKAFADALNINADTLDGQQGSYYLNYNNLNNTPTNLSDFTNDRKFLDSNAINAMVDSGYVRTRQEHYIDSALSELRFIDSNEIRQLVDSAYVQARQSLDSAEVISQVDSNYVQSRIDKTFIDTLNVDADTLDGFHGTYYSNYNNLTNKPLILDIVDVRQIAGDLVDSDYLDHRVRSFFSAGGDLTYDSATGRFSIDVEQIYTDSNFDSDFAFRLTFTTTDSIAEGSTNLYYTDARVTAHVDSAYVRARVRTNQDLYTHDSVTFGGIHISDNNISFGESDARMSYLPDSDLIVFNKPVKGEDAQFNGATVFSDSGTFNGLQVFDNRRGQRDWVARFTRRQNEFNSPAVVLISTDAENRSDIAFEIRGNANSNALSPVGQEQFHDDDNTKFAVYGSGHTLIGYSNLPEGTYSMLSGDQNIRLQVKHGISVDSNLVLHAGNLGSFNVSEFINDVKYLDSTTVSGVINATYINTNIDSATIVNIVSGDSNSFISIVDSDYVNARLNTTLFLDSAEVIDLVDSAYVRARVRTNQDLYTNSTVTFNQINGPANFVIDPATVGDNTGTVQILGNLQVEGTQTTINSTTVSINDKNIVLADSASNAAAADGAGITINGANATMQYAASGDKFVFNKPIEGTYLGFDSDFAAKTTDDLSEGSTNLYYTTARHDSDFDIRLAAKTTDNLSEGSTNLYYTSARADSDARSSIVVVDAGGDGSIAYDSSLGKITYTGPSASEVRSHFSVSGDLSYDSTTGQFSVDVEAAYSDSNFDSDFSARTTDDLPEGSSNLYYTDSRVETKINAYVDSSFINTFVSTSTEINNSIVNIIDSTYIATLSADSSVIPAVVDSAYVRARVRTNQDLRTTDSVTFGGLKVTDNNFYFGESNAVMVYLPDSDKVFFNKPIKVDAEANFSSAQIGTDSGTFTGLYVYDARLNSANNRDWVARFSRKTNEVASAATVLISNDGEERSDIAFEVRGNIQGHLVNDQTSFRDDDNTDFVIFGSGHTLIGYSNIGTSPYQMLAGDNSVKLQVSHGISVDSNIVLHAGNYTTFIDSNYIETRRPPETIFDVGTNGSSAYRFTGEGFTSARDNPTLYLIRGKTYKFNMNASGHPFQIRVSNGGSAYNTGVTNNGSQTGDIFFTPDMNAPTNLVYQCTVHSGMVGNIVILDGTGSGGIDSALVIQLIDSAYVQAREAAGGGGGTLDSATIDTVIDSDYIKLRSDYDADDFFSFGKELYRVGTLSGAGSNTGTQLASFFGAGTPGQFVSTYDYANGGVALGTWVTGYYWVNSSIGYAQITNKKDNGNGSYTYYTTPNLSTASGWTNVIYIAGQSGGVLTPMRVKHDTLGNEVQFHLNRDLHFMVSGSKEIKMTGQSKLDLGAKPIYFSNSFDSPNLFPSATTYPGMIVAIDSVGIYPGAAYVSHDGQWNKLTGTGIDSAAAKLIVLANIDSDHFVAGKSERNWNITSAAPPQISTGDFWLDRDDLNVYQLQASGNWSTTLPAGSFSAEAGLVSNNVFTTSPGVASTSFNIGASHTPAGPNGTFNSTFRVNTTYNSGGRWTFSNPVNFGYFYFGNSDAGHLWSIGYEDGSYMVANGGLSGSKTATPSSYTWYDAAGVSLGKTINQGNSGAHTHDVRHPNGKLATYIIFGRNNYGTRNYDAWGFFSGANSWQKIGKIFDSAEIRTLGTGTGVDSALTTQLIDSAYIQARQSGGGTGTVDSADIIAIVDSAYIQARQTTAGNVAAFNTFTYSASASQTLFTGADKNGSTLSYNTNTNQISVYVNGVLLTDSDDYTEDSGSAISLTTAAAASDVVTIIKAVNDGSGGGTVDSAYVTSQVPTFGTDFIDSAEAIKLITANAIDSGVALTLLLDSIETINLIDSAYVRQRVTKSDLDMEGNKVLFGNLYDSPGLFPNAGTYHGMFAHAHNTGAGYFAHAGGWIRLANHVDLGVAIQDEGSPLSTAATTLNFVGSGVTASGTGTNKTITITGGGGGGTVDSADIIAIVDSAYINGRLDFDPANLGEYETTRSQYTATSGQTVFNHNATDTNNLDVYLNGILQVVNDDYTASSTAVTFGTGVDSGYSVTIVERQGHVLTQRGLIETKYYFTTATPTTSITGSDDNGATLDYSNGLLDVYLNGILLKDSDDYSTNAGTIVTLVSATDSNDLVTLINRKGVVVSPNVKNYEFTATASQTTFTGADINSNTLSYAPNAIQVYLNGILLRNEDFTATNGTSVVLATGANVNDELIVSAFANPGHDLTTFKYTATAGQTIFSGTDVSGAAMTYNPGNIQVFMNGLLLNDSDDYIASNGLSVVLNTGADLSDEIKVASFVTNSNALRGVNAWSAPSGTVSAAAGDKLFIDTSGGARTVTLPSSASMGDEIRIIDVTGNASSNNITVERNGHKILGATSNLTINIDRAGIGLVYYNVAQGWVLIEN